MHFQTCILLGAICYNLAYAAPMGGNETPKGHKIETETDIEDYLRHFYGLGPMPAAVLGSPASVTDHQHARRQAVRRLQRQAGLPQTGEVDAATREVMDLPRCGVSTASDTEYDGSRKKRYAVEGSKWRNTELTYRIINFSPDLPTDTQESEIARALNVWTDYTPLTFTRLTSGRADIEISFGSFDHGDDFPFDGPGNVLAHAFFPRFGGDAHMDDSENFSAFTFSGINMFQVLAHEFGHSLGLEHSDIQTALMAAFYRGYVPDFNLDTDDILGIQSIYGVKQQTNPTTRSTTTTRRTTTTRPTTTRTTTTRPTTTTTRKTTTLSSRPTTTTRPTTTVRPSTTTTGPFSGSPDICSVGAFDAITTAFGTTYGFIGSQYVILNDKGVEEGYPRDITNDLGLPSDLDAAISLPAEYEYFSWRGRYYKRLLEPVRTYMFKGSQCWRFEENGLVSGYPKPISVDFPGLPNDLDAALVWSGNDRSYFFKGDKYYRVTSGVGVDEGYPRDLSVWGLPVSRVNAAFQYVNRRTYFFSGQEYYRYNDQALQIDSSYPRSISTWWFDCPTSYSSLKQIGGLEVMEEVEESAGEAVMGVEHIESHTMDPEMMEAEYVSGEPWADDMGEGDTPTGGQGRVACTTYTTVISAAVMVLLTFSV